MFVTYLIHTTDPLTDGQDILFRFVFEKAFVNEMPKPISDSPPKNTFAHTIYDILSCNSSDRRNLFSILKTVISGLDRITRIKNTRGIVLHWILRNYDEVLTLEHYDILKKRYPIPDFNSFHTETRASSSVYPINFR
jgi:hypothetical protein